jgi:hypothetical protein
VQFPQIRVVGWVRCQPAWGLGLGLQLGLVRIGLVGGLGFVQWKPGEFVLGVGIGLSVRAVVGLAMRERGKDRPGLEAELGPRVEGLLLAARLLAAQILEARLLAAELGPRVEGLLLAARLLAAQILEARLLAAELGPRVEGLLLAARLLADGQSAELLPLADQARVARRDPAPAVFGTASALAGHAGFASSPH